MSVTSIQKPSQIANVALANAAQAKAKTSQASSAPARPVTPANTPSAVVSLKSTPKTEPVAQNDSAGFEAKGGNVIVDVKASESGFNNKIYYSTDNFKTRHYVGVDNNQTSVNLGSFKAGTKIEFGIENDHGEFYRTGGASKNADGVNHSQQKQTASGTEIGFEDLRGGGDRDFNDAIIQVRNEASNVSEKTKDNRSGLADGSNPGVGGGQVNAPNTGTNNPASVSKNQTTAVVASASVVNKQAAVNAYAQVASFAPKPELNKAVSTASSKPSASVSDSKANASASTTVSKPTSTLSTSNAAALKVVSAPDKPQSNAKVAVDAYKQVANYVKVVDSAAKNTTASSNTNSVSQSTANKTSTNNVVSLNTNRSGLADGTNPGQGAGRSNATNSGTLNPNQVKAR